MTIYSGFSHWKWWFSIAMLVYQRVAKKNPPWRPVCKSDNIYNICVAINLSISKGICPPSFESKRGGGGKHLSCQVRGSFVGKHVRCMVSTNAMSFQFAHQTIPRWRSWASSSALPPAFWRKFRFAIEHVGRCRDEVEHVEVRWSSSLPRPRGSRGWHFWDIS